MRAGLPAPDHLDDAALLDAHAQAGRFGLRGRGVDPLTGAPCPLLACLAALVERARPGLRAAGDEALVDRLVERVRLQGNGADRQRGAFARHGTLPGVVADLALATSAG